jgi:predicted helicase
VTGVEVFRAFVNAAKNREDHPQYILRLIGQVITVSLETVRVVKTLPGLNIAGS